MNKGVTYVCREVDAIEEGGGHDLLERLAGHLGVERLETLLGGQEAAEMELVRLASTDIWEEERRL